MHARASESCCANFMAMLSSGIENTFRVLIYRKIPIISPGLIFVQKAFLLGLLSGELNFGGAYYWKEFCISKGVGLDNKNSLKQLALTVHELIFGRVYCRKDFWV